MLDSSDLSIEIINSEDCIGVGDIKISKLSILRNLFENSIVFYVKLETLYQFVYFILILNFMSFINYSWYCNFFGSTYLRSPEVFYFLAILPTVLIFSKSSYDFKNKIEEKLIKNLISKRNTLEGKEILDLLLFVLTPAYFQSIFVFYLFTYIIQSTFSYDGHELGISVFAVGISISHYIILILKVHKYILLN